MTKCPECNDTGERDSGGTHPWGEPVYLPCDCKDAEIGRRWREDSSLEKWFPITAERLSMLEQWAMDCRDQVLYPAAQRGDAIGKAADGLGQALERLTKGRTRMVDVEDMRLRLRQLHDMGHGTDCTDYHRLLPLAWAAAREALGPNAE